MEKNGVNNKSENQNINKKEKNEIINQDKSAFKNIINKFEPKKEEKNDPKKNDIKKFNIDEILQNMNTQKKEEKEKIIPKKMNINEILDNMKINEEDENNIEKSKTYKKEINFKINIKEKLAIFSTKEDDSNKNKKEKTPPKKIDIIKHTKAMAENLQHNNPPKEIKEINKIDTEKYINKMKEEQFLKKTYEIIKITPKKINIEEYLNNMKKTTKNYIVIRKKSPKKINTEDLLNDMNEKKNFKNTENVTDDNNKKDSIVSDRISALKEKELEKQKIKEEMKKIEELRAKRIEERKKREEELKIKKEEKKRKEEEERIKKEKEEEEERKKREEERIKKMIEEEEERKKREEEEIKKMIEEENKLKLEILQQFNKKEEDFSKEELEKLIIELRYKKQVEAHENQKYRDFDYYGEGKNIKYNFNEIKQISTEPIRNIEITDEKILVLTYENISKITIFDKNTYKEENCIVLESLVNSMKISNDKIYCALSETSDNILIISLNYYYDKTYLNGHNYSVNDLAFVTPFSKDDEKFISADIKGNIFAWRDNKITKYANNFNDLIDSITEINTSKRQIAALCSNRSQVKFYDLRYSELICIATINDIKGSRFKNNIINVNYNIIAIVGYYIYIVDVNSFIVTNKINCVYINSCISILSEEKGSCYFLVGQGLLNCYTDEIENVILGYYEYNLKDEIIPDYNSLIKLASKTFSHEKLITSIRKIEDNIIVTGSYDGKIKIWKLTKI